MAAPAREGLDGSVKLYAIPRRAPEQKLVFDSAGRDIKEEIANPVSLVAP